MSFAQGDKDGATITLSTAPPSQFQLKTSYRKFLKSYYLVDSVENLSQLDLASLIEQTYTQQVEEYYVSEDRRVVRIHFLDHSDNVFKYQKPTLMVMDTGGVALYGSDGAVITSYHPDPLDPINMDSLYLPLTRLTSEQLDTLRARGAIVTEYSNGNVKIENGENTTFEGDGFRYMSFNRYSDDGDLLAREEVLLKELSSGHTVLAKRKSTQYVTLPSGACAELIDEATYTNYAIDDRRVGSRMKRLPDKEEADAVTLRPNPIDDYMEVSVRNVFPDAKELVIEIYSMDGHLVGKKRMENSSHFAFSLSSLKAGMYLLKLSDDSGHRVTKKFVKL